MIERLDAWMARSNALYYATRDPFADFTTAPEIAQAFGEVLGAWAAVTWQQMGCPDPVLLVELGPGRGTLMADALRLAGRVAPGFRAALRVHLVESSPRLRAAQAARLGGGGEAGRDDPGAGVPGAGGPEGPTWHAALGTLPDGPAIVLANEFLDALPIRQLVRRGGAWMEQHVADGGFVERPAAPLGLAAPEGAVVELGEAAQALVARLAERLVRQGGVALVLDYGAAGSVAGDSLQALQGGRPVPLLAGFGTADLTAHVDFGAVAGAARAAGAACWGPLPQGQLLARIGLFERTERLALAHPERAAGLREAADRLAAPSRMGRLFQALAFGDPRLPVAAGFEPVS